MQNIRNIIFDYGNVIFSIDFSRTQQAFEQLGMQDVHRFYGHLAQDPIFDAFDKGEATSAEFRDALRKMSGKPGLSDRAIDDAWNALLIGVRDDHHELLLDLKSKYRTFLLSNNNPIHYDWIMKHLKEKFDLDGNAGFFEHDYYSHLMGMRKPDPEIFEYVIRKHDLNPKETLFIDDSPQHIATADRLGLHTALLTLPDTLPELLSRHDIK